MTCPRCRHENRPQAKFCEECATPLSRVCSNCSAPLSPTAKFCPECAHPVAASGVQRFASPNSYTPQYLAEKILTSKSALDKNVRERAAQVGRPMGYRFAEGFVRQACAAIDEL